MAKQPTQARVRRRERKNITNGIAHVNSTFNNTMITISDVQGNTIAGRQPVQWDSRDRVNQHLLPHRWRLKIRQKSV